MKIQKTSTNKALPWSNAVALMITVMFATSVAQASTDYGPAIWRPNCGQFYTSGNLHRFHVIHVAEGYYLGTISYFQQCGTQASSHYLVNSDNNSSDGVPAGEITQFVREQYWAWHARCWNTYMFGTEHEGFVSNPAWFTDKMYEVSANLSRHLADVWGFTKDRNHIIGHNEWQNSAWVAWVRANYSFDPTCNTHTDPGQYWNWSKYMSLINPTAIIVDNNNAGFSASANWSTGTSAPGHYGADYRFRGTQAVSDVATWTANAPTSGNYNVYAWWSVGSNRSTTAPYIVHHSGGTTVVHVNQQANGGQWNLLGTFNLGAGANDVDLSCWTTTGFVVIADAIKWVKQ